MIKNHNRQDKSSVAVFYDFLAPVYARFREYRHQRDGRAKERLINILAPFEQDVVLDIGTGPGIYALDIAKRAPSSQVIGIDISKTFIDIANDRATATETNNIDFSLGNIELLDFNDETFTKIICAGVLSVVKKRKQAVKELARVLATGGRLAVREPRRSEGIAGELLGNLPEKSSFRKAASRMGLMFGHFSPDFMTGSEFEALFANAGFSRYDIELYDRDVLITAVK